MRGFSTLELLLALFIMTTTLTGIVLVTLGLPHALAEGEREITASSFAAKLLEQTLIAGADDFSSVASSATSTIHIGTDTFENALTVVLSSDGGTKFLIDSIRWNDSYSTVHFQNFTALLDNTAAAQTNAVCTIERDSLWAVLATTTATLADDSLLPPGTSSGTHRIAALAANSRHLVLASDTTIKKADPTLFVFDFIGSSSPLYRTSFDNATSSKTGITAVALQNDLLFSTNGINADFTSCRTGPACSQLQIFTIGTSSTSTLVENYQLATSSGPYANGSNGQATGRSILVQNDLAYIGLIKTNSTQGDEFNIVDIHIPTAPIWLGGFHVGRSVNQIQVARGFAYLTTDDPLRELIVLDVHDPTHIHLAGSYDAPGAHTFGYGEVLSIASSTLAFGRSYIPDIPEFSVLSIASATSATLIGSTLAGTTTNPTNVEAILLQGLLGFVVTDQSLQLFNLHNLPSLQPYTSIPLPSGPLGTAKALACKDNTLYIGSDDATNTGYLTTVTGT